jgi:energy-coupling factor transporter ATP-binding protein EcfA2
VIFLISIKMELKVLCFTFLVLCFNNKNSQVIGQNNNVNNTLIDEVFELLKISLGYPNPASDEAILLVGLTGSGKTTLAQFLTGDNSKLISVPVSDEDDGQFYIIDENDTIGSNITISKTVHPEIYVDGPTSKVLVDCPGFADTRSETYDIAITIFIKNIFKWAKHIKIIMVVNYSALQKVGGSRDEFTSLLTHMTNMLKNYDNYRSSIGIIATKVGNTYTFSKGMPRLVPDETIIRQIANFITVVKNERTKIEEIKFLDDLLKKNYQDVHTNIAIFRKPNAAGPLEDLVDFQNGKTKIREMLFNNTIYADSEISDIGLKISKNSEIVVIEMCNQIEKNIKSLLGVFKLRIIEHFNLIIRTTNSYEKLQSDLENAHTLFNHAEPNVEGIKNELMWFFNFLETNEIIKNSFPEQTYKNIIAQLEYLSLLQSVSNSELVKSTFRWRDYFADLVNYLSENSKWYSFILTAFERMSQYDIQKNKTNIKIKTLQDWSQFKQFIVDDLRMKPEALIRNKIELNEQERKSLADILNTTLSPMSSQYLINDQSSCELRIEGYFVKMSDIQINQTVLAITIFAQYTVFIDSSFNKEGQEVFMTIIAPKWEVIGQQTINLNGKKPDLKIPVEGDGSAGLPGGPGGTFFGIGSEFANGNFLNVSTNGGTGGDGVDGENGKDGSVDIDVDIVKNYICKTDHESGKHYIVLNNIEYKIIGKIEAVTAQNHLYRGFNAEITIESVSKPISGFSGGKQGLGGVHSESTKIISLYKPSQIALSNNIGISGHSGKGGKGGKGEITDGRIVIYYEELMSLGLLSKVLNSICKVKEEERGKIQPNAADGCNDCSGEQLQPKKNLQATYSVVSKYRTFLLKQTTDEFIVNIKSPQSFLNALNSNEKIINLA